MPFVVKTKIILLWTQKVTQKVQDNLKFFYQPVTNFTVHQRVHYMGIKIFNNLTPYINPLMLNDL
jgi:hypothetical protein